MKRPKPGDIFEVVVNTERRYVQVTHIHPEFGPLVRVISGSWSSPPDLDALAQAPTEFVCFVRLGSRNPPHHLKYFGSYAVHADARDFPMFRSGLSGRDKKVHVWWLWDGVKSWKIGALKPEQRDFPIRGIWDEEMLVERLENGWSPRSDIR
jgi:hypothetical protein